DHVAVDIQLAAVGLVAAVLRAGFERRVEDAAVEVLACELGPRDRVPQLLGRRAHEDGIDLRCGCSHGRHALSSSVVLRSASAATRCSVYLSIQRSWMSRIGTGFR